MEASSRPRLLRTARWAQRWVREMPHERTAACLACLPAPHTYLWSPLALTPRPHSAALRRRRRLGEHEGSAVARSAVLHGPAAAAQGARRAAPARRAALNTRCRAGVAASCVLTFARRSGANSTPAPPRSRRCLWPCRRVAATGVTRRSSRAPPCPNSEPSRPFFSPPSWCAGGRPTPRTGATCTPAAGLRFWRGGRARARRPPPRRRRAPPSPLPGRTARPPPPGCGPPPRLRRRAPRRGRRG